MPTMLSGRVTSFSPSVHLAIFWRINGLDGTLAIRDVETEMLYQDAKQL